MTSRKKMTKLKNYTTTIPAFKSISEIQEFLIAFGTQNIIMDNEDSKIKAIKFTYRIGDMILPFIIPANVDNTVEVLWKEYLKHRTRQARKTKEDFREEAERISWRIARDWVHAQLSILTIQAADFIDVFAGYLVTNTQTCETLGNYLKNGKIQKLLKGNINGNIVGGNKDDQK